MRAEQFAGLLVEDRLYKAILGAERNGLAIADEREAAHLDVETLRLGSRFGEADTCNLRV